jgi:2,3-diketo-5-methylthio-1-phosphopentane phosphatase
MTSWTILCDFDGTISTCDVTDALLERFARPGWELLEQAWRTGRIGSRECMAGQVALLDASADELDALVDTIGIDAAFPAFVARARAAGANVVVVSDGLHRVIARILANHGIDDLPVVANRLLQVNVCDWQAEFPHGDAACRSGSGNCKCACARRHQESHRRTLLIGDGQSDFCAAGSVDFVFAKHKLLEHCRQVGLPHAAISGFDDAIALLPRLLGGQLLPASQSPESILIAS